MSIKSFAGISLVFCITLALFSCQKVANNTPVISGPLVVLTPSTVSGYGGDQVSIDYSCTAASGVKRVVITEQYLSNTKRTDLDSTLSTTAAAIDRNFIYTIPDSAIAGQQTILTFTIIDGSGNSTSKIATVTVTGSKPSISVSPGSVTAAPGDSVLFTITMKSPEKNITTLDISQEIGTGPVTNLPSFPYPAISYKVQPFYYHVPTTAQNGNAISVVFKVLNSSGINNSVGANVTVN